MLIYRIEGLDKSRWKVFKPFKWAESKTPEWLLQWKIDANIYNAQSVSGMFVAFNL